MRQFGLVYSEYTILTQLAYVVHGPPQVLHVWSSFSVYVELFSAVLVLSLIHSFCFFFCVEVRRFSLQLSNFWTVFVINNIVDWFAWWRTVLSFMPFHLCRKIPVSEFRNICKVTKSPTHIFTFVICLHRF